MLRYTATINERDMWKVYWYYKISNYAFANKQHSFLFYKADAMMINDLYLSNK
jgi:hypothetical protein